MRVTILQPMQQLMQRGHGRGDWVLEYELETRRYPEPLMGWTASGDTLNSVKLSFQSLDEGTSFAASKGWEYDVVEAHRRVVKPRTYIDNFKTRGDREA